MYDKECTDFTLNILIKQNQMFQTMCNLNTENANLKVQNKTLKRSCMTRPNVQVENAVTSKVNSALDTRANRSNQLDEVTSEPMKRPSDIAWQFCGSRK